MCAPWLDLPCFKYPVTTCPLAAILPSTGLSSGDISIGQCDPTICTLKVGKSTLELEILPETSN